MTQKKRGKTFDSDYTFRTDMEREEEEEEEEGQEMEMRGLIPQAKTKETD